MTAKLPISVFIIAKNEADVIAYAIESVRGWVDEVVLVDSGSTDDTVKIAESLGARSLFHAWEGYGQQKIFSEGQCRHPWILNIDADEEISPALAQEIQALFAKGEPSQAAFTMRWKILFGHERTPRRFATGSTFVRLYDVRRAGFRNSTVHDSVVVRDGALGELREWVWHRNFRSFEHWRQKVEIYSSMQAEDMVARGRRPATVRLIVEPVFAFFKSYFIRRYWAYGLDGYILSWLYAHAKYIRLVKARDLWRAKQR